MRPNAAGHGCFYLVTMVCAVCQTHAESPIPVRSRVFDIQYAVNAKALPLDAVHLWYTLDRGATWRDAGFDEDRQSPFSFITPREGLYGLFLVVENATGPSSTPPTQSTKAQLWAMVDYTPPVVQLHPLRQTMLLAQRVLQIRWTAIDAQLSARPININYRRLPDMDWHPVGLEPLANTGRYDWRLPGDLAGPVALRICASDKGGHRVCSDPQVFEVASSRPVSKASSEKPRPARGVAREVVKRVGSSMTPSRGESRTDRLFAEAADYRNRGDYRAAISRLREVVRIEPRRTEAFAEMADMLYRVGDLDQALNGYELALQQRPGMRAALRGAAMVHRRQSDFASASRRLRTILRHNPDDAEVWLNLGDVAIFQGDDTLARECYLRATNIDPDAPRIIEDARKRLALMTEVSRTYGRDGR